MGTKTEMMSGAQIIIETLIEQGVTDVFGYPGGQVLNIYDELYKASDRINHVLAAHEQGASHAADGYSRVTGKVGVVIATSGPGATNLVTGIATAMLDSIPMVAITGNVPTSLIGKDSFQEINIMGITLPITKHNYFVTDVNELADTIREAFQIAKSGRPGPVLIDVPKDVQIAKCEYERKGVVDFAPLKIADDSDVEKAVELINKCEKPYIYIGGGAAGLGMTKEIMAFADKIDAYIGCTFMGLSAMPNSYERFLGMEGMHGHYASSMANKEADLIIGIGVRFSDRATGNTAKYATGAKLIQLDVDLSEINKNIQVDVGLVGDIKSSFARISERCEKAEHKQWEQEVTALKTEEKRIIDEAEEASNGAMTPKKIFDVINKIKDKSTIIATDVGQHQMWAAQYTDFEQKRRFASSGGLGTMGYGLGAAIGAAVATGDKTVLITGDGSFGMNLNELATAVTYNTPIVIVLLNNGVLGMVRQWQTLFFGKRYSNTTLGRKTDFVKLAEAFGLEAERVSSIDEFEQAFKRGMAYNGPYLIDTLINMDEFVLPMLPPGGSIDDIITKVEEN
ncbi:MAG: biosynthetic-type acetolactate synthase large subunit [Ruminococcus sp.]|nr:biosynthetic-type acetolactate synthase large subunit [Ruminococcus sp.]MDY4910120.1 biosynthetic-type acetolactate synthase large subunit [Candidatus Fimenecus sp.]